MGGAGGPEPDRLRMLTGIWAAVTFLAVIVGPFGTYDEMTLPRRAVYWAVVAGGGILIGVTIRDQLYRRLPPLPPAAEVMVQALVVTAFLGPAIWLFSHLMRPAHGPMPPALPAMLAMVFAVSIGIGMLRCMLRRISSPDEEETAPEPRLLRRLPAERRGRLLRCEVSGHHTLIVTEAGQETLRLRFCDAVSELEDVDGLRVHRSHWVARDAVRGHGNVNGRLFLTLADGARVPVSRNYRRDVEESGLIDRAG